MALPKVTTPKSDRETEAILYGGATITQLVRIFGGNHKDVKAAMYGLVPTEVRQGHQCYSIKEAAARLLPPDGDQVERILKMNHTDLPKMLSKEFWYGQNQKLTYEERTGDLWRTTDIVEMAGDAFKTLRLSLLLLTDAVERESALTDQQRDTITKLLDSALRDMKRKLIDAFNDRKRRKPAASEPQPPENDDPAEGL